MGYFIRKSKKVGPFRINLSTKGVGISTGITGARLSVGPNGTHVHLGRHGLYYRKKIGSKSKHPSNRKDPLRRTSYSTNKQYIETSNFNDITDVESEDFIKELTEKESKLSFHRWLGILPLIISLGIAYPYFIQERNVPVKQRMFKVKAEGANVRSSPNINSEVLDIVTQNSLLEVVEEQEKWTKVNTKNDKQGYISNSTGSKGFVKRNRLTKSFGIPDTLTCLVIGFIWFSLILWTIYLYWLDKKRKTIEINYSMEDEFINFYDNQLLNFDEACRNQKIWQIKSKAKSKNTKYTSGASSLVDKILIKAMSRDSLPSSLLKTNVEIPHISLDKIDLFFFPERLVLKRGKKYASLFYMNLDIDINDVNFTVNSKVPRDAKVIDKTWEYVNKDGGPDRRFNNNRELPICLFTQYHFNCDYGINEVLMTSRHRGMDNFFNFLVTIGNVQQEYLATSN